MRASTSPDTVHLTVENSSDRTAEIELTDIVAGSEPALENGDASIVEMDDEWFVRWSVSVASGEETTLSYGVDGEADFEVSVDGIEDERLTVNA